MEGGIEVVANEGVYDLKDDIHGGRWAESDSKSQYWPSLKRRLE